MLWGRGRAPSSVETLMKRLMLPHLRLASRSTCVPYVLFIVKSNELPNELSTCVCMQATLASEIDVAGGRVHADHD